MTDYLLTALIPMALFFVVLFMVAKKLRTKMDS